jgi:AcrR family transcriptional regulator
MAASGSAYSGRVHESRVESVETRRRDMREAILAATAAVVAEHGLPAVTMSRIAAQAGIAQSRLCRYFPDLDAVMRAWHDRQVTNHLGYLEDIGDQSGAVMQRLDAVLRAYAAVVHQTHEHRTTDLGMSLHRDEDLGHARRHLRGVVRDLLAEGALGGDIRDDVTPDELADFCLRSLSSAGAHSSSVAVRHLVTATLCRLRSARPDGQDH